MALHLVLCRSYVKASRLSPTRFKISHISRYSESEEWSTIHLFPEFPKSISDVTYDVTCSGNGLLCFFYGGDYEDGEFVVWNPSTDKFQFIPYADSRYLPCACSSRRCVTTLLCDKGLGFVNVAESQDYKFVRFMDNCNEASDGGVHDVSRHVAVYSSRNNSWKELPFPFDYRYDIVGDATCVNGVCFWKTRVDVILSLDLSSDEFSTLPYPDDVIAPDIADVFLLEYLDGSSLGLVIQFQLAITTKLFSFWVYTTSSSSSSSPWTRKINLDVRLDAGVAEKPLWLGNQNNGGEYFLLLQGFDGALLEYDYTTRELKKIDQINDQNRSEMRIFPYVETGNANIGDGDRDGDGVDRISQLPDDIIITILSLLPLKEAATTSVLSTRWSDLWKHTPNLNFNFNDIFFRRDKHKYEEWVNSAMESYRALSLKEFSISFPLKYSTRNKVSKWLEFAFSRRVQVLELNLLRTRFVFLERFLRQLKSTNLTSLCLKCVKVRGEAIGLFLRNCPLLERLIIKYAVLTSDLEVCGGVLKHLDIQYCKGVNTIKGYAPNLTYLRLDSSWAAQQYTDDPRSLFFISSQLTTLDFTLSRPLEGILEKGFPQMSTLRELIITYHECGWGIHPITSLICALPYLEKFEIKLYTGSRLKQHGREVVNNVENCYYRHLRVFKFAWFNVGDSDHLELVSYILDNYTALQKIILHKYVTDSPSHVAATEYAKQLHSRIPSHIQLIIN